MCDTMVALPNSTCDGSLLFAKNSDREPNEPHIIVKVPGREIKKGESIRCTYIDVTREDEQAQRTFEMILFKPEWIWGAEMGVNEKGLVIGNEAVFTKEKVENNTLLGMDILRLALEVCSTAEDALHYMTALIEEYGQGGKAGYTENLKYHNSYIIADFNDAYVLETAGRRWVYDKVKDVYSISNTITIRNNFTGGSRDLVEYAVSKGWCRSYEDFKFKSCYESRLYPYFTKGDARQAITEGFLKSKAGSLEIRDMKNILRSHGRRLDVESFSAGSMECVCMHGGGIVSSQTTGSFIVQLTGGKINIWATGSSLPCISVYKPIWFTGSNSAFDEGNREELTGYWRRMETLRRMALDGRIQELDEYLILRDDLEDELTKMAAEAETGEDKTKVTEYAFESEERLVEKTVANALSDNVYPSRMANKRGLYYKWYWRKQNRMLK